MTQPPDETQVRLNNHSQRLVVLEEASERTQKRVTDLESDRETVHNLVTTIGLLASKVQEMAQGVDTIAERAVAKVLSERKNIRKQNWKHALGLVSAGAGATGAIVGVLVYVFHVLHLA
jgi:VIT1/CCC1 family predicted Fe2+/Mn2+ transporter